MHLSAEVDAPWQFGRLLYEDVWTQSPSIVPINMYLLNLTTSCHPEADIGFRGC